MYQERPQPKETRMFRHVPMQAIVETLKTLPIPITLIQYLDTQTEQFYYGYQVGIPTDEHPAGLCMGATPNFLEAVRLSLEAVMTRQTGQVTDTRQLRQEPSPIRDEWLVSGVERTMHEQKDVGEQQEEDEAAMIHVLRNLPVSVNIWKREDGYIWQCYEHCGITADFAGGVREGLLALMRHLVSEKTRGVYRSFGEVLFQTEDGYTERVIANTDRGRVVMCDMRGSIKLYRIEWTEPDGYVQNRAAYSLQEAMDAFQEVSLEQR
jgi:hypothetical protein